MNTITAINSKNQRAINKAVKWLVKHNDYNLQRDEADNDGDTKKVDKLTTKCENTFNKYLEYCEELPKREVKQIEKSNLY